MKEVDVVKHGDPKRKLRFHKRSITVSNNDLIGYNAIYTQHNRNLQTHLHHVLTARAAPLARVPTGMGTWAINYLDNFLLDNATRVPERTWHQCKVSTITLLSSRNSELLLTKRSVSPLLVLLHKSSLNVLSFIWVVSMRDAAKFGHDWSCTVGRQAPPKRNKNWTNLRFYASHLW